MSSPGWLTRCPARSPLHSGGNISVDLPVLILRPVGHCSDSPGPNTPAPARPVVPVGDGRAGGRYGRWGMLLDSGRVGLAVHAGRLPAGLPWVRMAFRRVLWGL